MADLQSFRLIGSVSLVIAVAATVGIAAYHRVSTVHETLSPAKTAAVEYQLKELCATIGFDPIDKLVPDHGELRSTDASQSQDTADAMHRNGQTANWSCLASSPKDMLNRRLLVTAILYGRADATGKSRDPADRCEASDESSFRDGTEAIGLDQGTVLRIPGWGDHGHLLVTPMAAGGFEAEFAGCRGPVGLRIDFKDPPVGRSSPALSQPRVQELTIGLATAVYGKLVP